MDFFIFTLILLFVLVIFYLHYAISPNREDRIFLRDSLKQALFLHRIDSEDPRFCFHPENATLVHSYERFGNSDGMGITHFGIHRIYRNLSGEYFLVIWSSGAPINLRHLPRDRAMNALRGYPEIFNKEFPNEDSSQ